MAVLSRTGYNLFNTYQGLKQIRAVVLLYKSLLGIEKK